MFVMDRLRMNGDYIYNYSLIGDLIYISWLESVGWCRGTRSINRTTSKMKI